MRPSDKIRCLFAAGAHRGKVEHLDDRRVIGEDDVGEVDDRMIFQEEGRDEVMISHGIPVNLWRKRKESVEEYDDDTHAEEDSFDKRDGLYRFEISAPVYFPEEEDNEGEIQEPHQEKRNP